MGMGMGTGMAVVVEMVARWRIPMGGVCVCVCVYVCVRVCDDTNNKTMYVI